MSLSPAYPAHSPARPLVALAGAGSTLLLAGALAFQAAGYNPCELCILQRWPHVAAVLIAAVALLLRRERPLAWLGALAAAVACGVAVYHAGIEYGAWSGPSACTGSNNIAGLSLDDLMAKINAAPVVRCDEVALRIFGLSMAGWNAILSAVLALVWLAAARRRPAR